MHVWEIIKAFKRNKEFKEEVKDYHKSKGTLPFPIKQPLPYDLIRKIVQYRVASNLKKAERKSQSRRS
ncbi:hypothetical protein C7R92_00650 [Brevibacillus porteri]|uniref:YqzE family protein n=1 Tax=Brevibacillus porteri TaxID=2126350 RepID=A0ABX5FWP8_9BACL|nr:hypothetical protein C7R92_00650 [Brevibacillus porteri]